jgi:UDP-3-O-[3-hydroxymyristoyl] glucosamine N-acyltransferase
MSHYTLQQLVDHLTGFDFKVELKGRSDTKISRIQSLTNATEGEISFLSDVKYLDRLPSTKASAVILKPENAESCPCDAILVDNPYAAYAFIAQKLYFKPVSAGIDDSAVVADSAQVHPSAQVGANCVIGEQVKIGQQVVIGAGSVLEDGVTVGEFSRLAPNVTVMQQCQIGTHCVIESGVVIGGDGFGWAKHQGQWIKIPQIGRVIVGNHVSIGNNTAIDRGAIEDTVIEDNCIIDNLVHIAHNVKIGSGTAIAGQVGFAGSAVVGKNCTFAGQAGMVGHIELTDGVTIMGRSVATHSIREAGAYAGFPAVPLAEWQKNAIYAKNLVKLSEKIKKLGQRLSKVENGGS